MDQTKTPLLSQRKYCLSENRSGCKDHKEDFVHLHHETAGCGSCIAKGRAFFRSGDNSPSTGHFTRKALLCVFAQNDKIRLRFYSSTHMLICKEEVIAFSLFLRDKGAQELIFGIEGAGQHDLIRTHAVFLCQFAEKTVAFHEAAL